MEKSPFIIFTVKLKILSAVEVLFALKLELEKIIIAITQCLFTSNDTNKPSLKGLSQSGNFD